MKVSIENNQELLAIKMEKNVVLCYKYKVDEYFVYGKIADVKQYLSVSQDNIKLLPFDCTIKTNVSYYLNNKSIHLVV